MKLRILGVALTVSAAGCAVGPTLEQRMLPFIGRSEGDIVAVLGTPVRTHEADDRKFLTFEERRSYIVAGDPLLYRGFGYGFGGYGRFGPYAPAPGYVVRFCEITFTFRDGRAEGFSSRGDGCR